MMTAKYWIKLYHEILHDPKMGRLTDRLWRRIIELFLMAGEANADGYLPSVGDMVWTLRCDEGELRQELKQLEAVKILSQDEHGWFVTKFAERQGPVSDAERMARYRDRQRQGQYYGDDNRYDRVTKRNVDEEADTDTDTDEEAEADTPAAPSTSPSPERWDRLPYRENPEALQVYYAETQCGLHPTWQARVEKVVGVLETDLSFWHNVIVGWLGQGWGDGNILGMLERYERHEIPGSGLAPLLNSAMPTGPPSEPRVIHGINDTPEWLRGPGNG